MDQNSRLGAKISKEKTRTLLTRGLEEVALLLTRISLQDKTPPTGTTIRTTEDHMIKAQISHSIETMQTDLEMNLSTTRMGFGETMDIFLVLHQLKRKIFNKIA